MEWQWSDWYECEFDSRGEINTRPLDRYAPEKPGVYAIAIKRTDGNFSVQYIGMSTWNIYRRLKKHFDAKGNHVIRAILRDRKDLENPPPGSGGATQMLKALYFAFLELPGKEAAEVMEAIYIDGREPIGNLIRGKVSKLPPGLRESDSVERED
jgi:hypothetical protein